MPALTIRCPHCAEASQVDSDRLPDGPASFACPHCRGKVVVDKRAVLGDQTTSAAAAAPVTPPAEDSAERSSPRLGRLPDNASFPSGILLGEDDSAMAEIEQAMANLGSEVERMSTAQEARELILNEHPRLCIYVAGAVSAPPHAGMAALTGLPPTARRQLYLVLVADNLKTLDGTAAFLYQVNMTLRKADLPQLGPALYRGLDYHDRLYKPYFLAVEQA